MEFFPYRPIPFSIFSRMFLYLRDPVFIFAKVENGVFRLFPSNPILIPNRPVYPVFNLYSTCSTITCPYVMLI
jgi:hypothetical protein